jgi:hypothetical protein
MIRDKAGIKGFVRATVFGPDGKVKIFKPNLLQKFLNYTGLSKYGWVPDRPMIIENRNIVTNHGDALIADALSDTQARTKVNNANGVIGVGTGYVSATKAVTALVTQTGSNKAMTATYPKLKGTFNAADDNVVQYRVNFLAGDLNDTGIDEVALGNGTDLMAYAQFSPAFPVASSDTLQVDWELTPLGA